MTDDLTLSFTRTLAASPANVWRCWTEPDLLKQWFAPKPVEVPVAEIDARPGGKFHIVMVVPDHGRMEGAPGCILVAEPGKRIVWTNALGPDFAPNKLGDGPTDFAFSADIVIEPDGAGCTYHVTVRHATAEAARSHEGMGFYDGWGTVTTQLGELAATL
ncbi:SRPBCC family protein [Flavimaricola marinus]|uniref:Activator of Hsp90 ATPase homologue 1/2-like C-terminal domain-containing protein n=1 Tax=Flavimaricola marinus TaxID=1819565 RepID=A0A238L8R9_9RHOB|nr:SRPBCC family protein [Flavimaricola marinus]SMY05991.1 hypothetical protein LOM8899_00112 [Flavimaricola marinus]